MLDMVEGMELFYTALGNVNGVDILESTLAIKKLNMSFPRNRQF